jgi:hypothetical protein
MRRPGRGPAFGLEVTALAIAACPSQPLMFRRFLMFQRGHDETGTSQCVEEFTALHAARYAFATNRSDDS